MSRCVRGNEKLIICGDLNGWVGTARSGYEGRLGQYGDTRVMRLESLFWKFARKGICLWQTLCFITNKFTCIHIHGSNGREKYN